MNIKYMLFFAKTSTLIQRTFPGYVWKIPVKDNSVFLTFDDGPIPEITPWVLDQLDQYGAKASFFCIGDNVKKNPDIYNKINDKGHLLCNHTFNHLNGWKTDTKQYIDNVLECSKLVNSRFFRPPYGQIRKKQATKLKANGFKIIMWDVLSWDFSPKCSPEKCLKNVVNNVEAGSIIVFHDNIKAKKNLTYALPKTLKYLKDNNFICRTLNDVQNAD